MRRRGLPGIAERRTGGPRQAEPLPKDNEAIASINGVGKSIVLEKDPIPLRGERRALQAPIA